MTESVPALPAEPGQPEIQTRKEVRLALVMYGGVSLAIYMNGVAQELYHLVRATAPKKLRREPGTPEAPENTQVLVPTEQLSGTEAVYRMLGQKLEELASNPNAPIAGVEPDLPISTRFVIDILSGTSAGGINAVFLAKALANDQPIEQLEDLWMEQGDISVLLNDSRSRVSGLTLESPPESLLNSERMYFNLLSAFDRMEHANRNPAGLSLSPYALELDLWVTTTDLRGVTLPIQIANGLAYERRYRNVFHFVYGTDEASGGDRNDFYGANNPMLAFASRCTSAFPFAFRPMLFGDMEEPLSLLDDYRAIQVEPKHWIRFYGDYFPSPGAGGPADLDPERQLPFRIRPFADGGALDNKPFSWATDTLLRRRADVPVDRKLIFIEPDPGHPESERRKQDRPDALHNFMLQGVSLPRQETIRQDIQAVLDRNRTLERIERVLRGVGEDAFTNPRAASSSTESWASLGIDAGIEEYGRGYGGYHRLKVATVTDDICDLVASVAGFDDASDELLAIRHVVRAWRDEHYDHHEGVKPETFNSFLVAFDLQHRLRRLTFLQRRADVMFTLDPEALKVIGYIKLPGPYGSPISLEVPEGDGLPPFRRDFQGELMKAKAALSGIYVRLRLLGRRLRSSTDSPLRPDVIGLGIGRDDLLRILRAESEVERTTLAKSFSSDRSSSFDALADHLTTFLRDGIPNPAPAPVPDPLFEPYGTSRASTDLRVALDPSTANSPGAVTARTVLRAYSDGFDDFDMVSFPMMYGSDAGEADPVEIVRIAPEDATSIIDERASAFTVRKTRGWKYNHFGAFLDADWRRNDIMFGRLDAAECLINTLVSSTNPDRSALLQRAQRAIILESLAPEQQAPVLGPGDPAQLPAGELVARFKANYRVAEDLTPGTALPIAGRGLDVTGKMLKGISGQTGIIKTPVGWFAKLGSLIARMVAVATPGSFQSLGFRHLVPMIVLFEAVITFLGWWLHSPSVLHLGVVALVVTLLLGAFVYWLSGLIRGRGWPVRVAKAGLILLVGAILALAAAEFVPNWRHPSQIGRDFVSLYHTIRPSTSPAPSPASPP